MDVKSISIEVSAKGIAPAAKALDNLSKAAGTASPVVQELQRQLDSFSNASFGSVISQLSNAASSVQRLKVATRDMSNTGQSFKGISTATSNIASAMERLVASTNGLVGFNEQLAKTAATLASMKGDAGVLSTLGRSTTASGGSRTASSSGSSTNETEALTKRQQAILRQIEYTTIYAEKGKVGWLEYRAAQLGVAGAAAPMIERLKAAGNQMGAGTISAKQYTAAMRMVPAQFTDIATQLAGGQNPLLILLQQGGQIKDMFGGSIPQALKATGTYLLSVLTNPLIIAAGAVAGLGYAFITAQNSMAALNKSLTLTNNYAGLTNTSFKDLTDSVGKSTGSLGRARDVVQALASAGVFTSSEIATLSTTIANTSKITGESVDKIVAQYVSLKDKPLQAILELNKGTNFLTSETYAHINALSEQGKTAEAASVAIQALKDYQDQLSKSAQDNLPKTTSLFQKLKDVLSNFGEGFKDFVNDFGTSDPDAQIVKYKNIIAAEEERAQRGQAGSEKLLEVYRKELAALEEQKKSLDATAAKQGRNTQNRKAETDLVEKLLSDQKGSLSNEEKRVSVLDRVKNEYKELRLRSAALTDEDFNQWLAARGILTEKQRLANETDKLKDKSKSAGVQQLGTLEAELQAIKENIAGYTAQGAAYEKVTENAKKLYSIQSQLGSPKLDSKQRANLEEQRAKLVEITGLEKTQKDLQDSAKRESTYAEQTKSLEATLKALQERNKALSEGKGVSSSLSETDKKLAKAEDDLARATTDHERAAINADIAVLKQVSSEEKSVKAKEDTLKITQDNIKVQEQSKAQYDALIAKYQQEQDAINHSEAEISKMTAVRQIEADAAQKVADVQAQINALNAQADADNSGQIAKLQERIKTIQDAKDKMVGLVNSQPNYKKLFGESELGDMKNGFQNFYNSLSTSQQLYQSAFQQGYSLMGNTLATFFKTGKVDAKEWAANMMGYIADVVAQLLVLKAIKAVVGWATTPSDDLSQNTQMDMGIIPARAHGAAFTSSGVSKYAKGGAFTNSVVSQPTFFASGGTFGGLNVMGEAGPEAVMPLTRNSQGDLSVNATGMGGGSVGVYVTVNADGSSSTSTSDTSDSQLKQLGAALGDRIRQTIATEMRPGGLLAGR